MRLAPALAFALALSCAACDSNGTPDPTTANVNILVPLYSEPGATWEAVEDAADRGGDAVEITVIINPDNGPVSADDEPEVVEDYNTAITSLRAHGVRVLGYVYTGYLGEQDERDEAETRADVALYAADYDVDGIFYDEVSYQAPAAPAYRALCAFAKDDHDFDYVVLNPGQNASTRYLENGVCDAMVVYESASPGSQWTGHAVADDLAVVAPARLGALPYAVPTQGAMQDAVDHAITEGIGLLYVTDDGGLNPWDSLPSYWTAFVDYVAQRNTEDIAE